MYPTFKVDFTGTINRRDLPSRVKPGQVLNRENMVVVGSGKERLNKKLPGSSRFTATTNGTRYTWGIRYYSKALKRHTFAFNNGVLYHIDDNGNESAKVSTFLATAYPCAENVRVSDNDNLYFAAGDGTGLYEYDGNNSQQFTKVNGFTLNPVGMLSYLDRMVYFEEDSEDLIISANLDPTDVTDATDAVLITIGAKRGSKIQQIAILNETLYIFKTDSIWVLNGRSPSEFSVREVHSKLGVGARRSVQTVETGIIFLGSDFEFHSFAGTVASTKLLSYDLAIAGDYTKDLPPLINRSKVESICSTYHNHLYRCSFVESGEVQNNLEYIFNTINETDAISRGNNVSCYIVWDRTPDGNELLTGKSDLGRLMRQNIGLNWDNDSEASTMPVKLQSAFVGDSNRNKRFLTAWGTFGVFGAEPLNIGYQVDSRAATSDARTDDWIIRGETKSLTSFVTISSQAAITSRVKLKHSGSMGQTISFYIDTNKQNLDFSMDSIEVEAIVKQSKRSQRVGL